MLTPYEKGKWGEEKAVEILKNLGYTVLAQRLRTPYGEIDILAQKGNTVIAVEVKLRKKLAYARECITEKQKLRIFYALQYVISERNINLENYRIDVICLNRAGGYEYIKNAFTNEEF